ITRIRLEKWPPNALVRSSLKNWSDQLTSRSSGDNRAFVTLGLEPVSRSSLSDAVFDQISQQILSRRVEPGAALPPERELAKALGVNRGAIREGLKRLAQAGLIEQRHGGVTTVLDYRRHAGLDLLTRLLVTPDGEPDRHVARSIMEMRAALGPDVARLCAMRADPQLGGLLR